MKITGFLGAILALIVVMFGASTAQAADYTPPGGVTVSPPSDTSNGCSTRTVTVSVPAGTTSVTLTVRNDSGSIVYQATKSTNGSSVSFTFRVCGSGDFTATATNQSGQVIGSSSFHNNGAGSQGSSSSSSSSSPSSGSLANTGASTAMTVGGLAAMLLLVGGAALLMASRRRA